MDAPTFFSTQPVVATQLFRSLKHGRLAHAYLFEGDSGTGKHEVALWLAKELLCLDKQEGQPCERCNNCTRINEGIHPDVMVLEPEGQTIKVDQIRNLQAEFAKSGYETKQKVFILKDAEKMNSSAANSLLKFLEDPASGILAVLETTSLGRILPTIQSRCQVLHFQPLSSEKLIEKLVAQGIGRESARLLCALTNSFDKAVEISQNEWFNELKGSVQQWFDYLRKRDPQSFIYVQKKLIKVMKDKQQQTMGLSILLYYYQDYLVQEIKKEGTKVASINEELRLILTAEQKLAANVAFQGVAEQLAIRITGMST